MFFNRKLMLKSSEFKLSAAVAHSGRKRELWAKAAEEEAREARAVHRFNIRTKFKHDDL